MCGTDFPERERVRDGGGWIDFVLSPLEIVEGLVELASGYEPRAWVFCWGVLHGLGLRFCIQHVSKLGWIVPGSRRRGLLALVNGTVSLLSLGTVAEFGSRYFGRSPPKA